MKNSSKSFTLIEVMLAVAVFAFAAVGFAVALNDVLGINVEMIRASQRRQAVESLAARILAASNNLQNGGKKWRPEPNYKYKTWGLESYCSPAEIIQLANSNQTTVRQAQGWFLVGVRAAGKNGESLDSVSFLLWPQR
ncbi:MAG: prepilin-type N-terminal cleavage/methylation domain-containing protein [Verrucomicrobia bacterium]|nr:prepilin-type N-terminal cleavage/methylation domain-containing protein [Verrucomicrobiota bacterium]